MKRFQGGAGLRFWLIAIAALVGMLITASLGRWQLSRAAEKESLQATFNARVAMPAVNATEMLIADLSTDKTVHALVHRTVVLQGRWLSDHTLYLDNRQMQGRPGFFVLTPLQLSGQNGVVLVQRGWAPRNFQDRTQLPPVLTPEGLVRVEGRVAPAPSRLFDFDGGGHSALGSSRIRQNLDLAAFRTETGLALAHLTVLQTGRDQDVGDGLQRDWPVLGAGVDKHYGYAFQWFGLSCLIALLYVWFQIVRRFIRPISQSAT